MKRARSLVVGALASALVSCSLLALDDFQTTPCVDERDCDRTKQEENRRLNRCGRYECRQGLCEWAGEERCNGLDDDCDGFVDEYVPVGGRASSGSLAPTVVARASHPSGSVSYVVAGSPQHVSGLLVTGAGPEDPKPLHYESAVGGELQCPRTVGSGAELTGMACNFQELALAADGRHLVFVSINSIGCTDGQVRIGLSDPERDPFAVWLGKATDAGSGEPNHIAAGVDVKDGCTGASRADARLGATRPAVASLDTGPGQSGALALWLAASSKGVRQCGERKSLAVEALRVFIPSGQVTGLDSVNDDGKPLQLSKRTTRLAAPAVLALQSPATLALGNPELPPFYLVAFVAEKSGEGEGIQLLKLIPGRYDLIESDFLFIPAEGAEEVTLARGNPSAEGREVTISWTSGCDTERRLHLARLSLTNPQVPDNLTIEAHHSVLPPQLLYAPTGFYAHSEGSHEAQPEGGWFLLWTQQTAGNGREFRFARAAEATRPSANQPTNAPFTLLNNVALSSRDWGYPVLFLTSDSKPGYAMISNDTDDSQQIETKFGWCG